MGKIVFTYWKNLLIEAAKEMGKGLGFWGLTFGLILSGVYAVYIGEQTFNLGGILVFAKVFLVLIIAAWIVFVFIVTAAKDKKKQDEINNFNELQNSKPIIKLIDYGFEIKGWENGQYTVNAYLDLSNQPKEGSINDVNSKGVYPFIVWTNEHGKEIDNNCGRWGIPNEDKLHTKISDLQTVDLDANGKPRRLYFTTGLYFPSDNNQSKKLYSWWRSLDGYNHSKIIIDSPTYVIVDLKDNRTSTARFRFKIEHSSNGLTMERINNKKQVIGSKKFDYAEFLKYEKKEDSNVKLKKPKNTKANRTKKRPH